MKKQRQCETCNGKATIIDGEAVHVDATGVPIKKDHPARVKLGSVG